MFVSGVQKTGFTPLGGDRLSRVSPQNRVQIHSKFAPKKTWFSSVILVTRREPKVVQNRSNSHRKFVAALGANFRYSRLSFGALLARKLELLRYPRRPCNYANSLMPVVLSKDGRQRGAPKASQERLQKYIRFSCAFSSDFRLQNQNGAQSLPRGGLKGDLKS